jgi:hypothetical protein
MLPHPVAVAANRHDGAVVHEPVDERGRHDGITEDGAPVFESLVRREHRGGMFIPPGHELEESIATVRLGGCSAFDAACYLQWGNYDGRRLLFQRRSLA